MNNKYNKLQNYIKNMKEHFPAQRRKMENTNKEIDSRRIDGVSNGGAA